MILYCSGGQLEAQEEMEEGELESSQGLNKTLTDSPASPDVAAMVTGSPILIIPASPPHRPLLSEEGGSGNSSREEDNEEEEEEEDIDEDILYLRLIALRSLAGEDRTERREKQVLAREMQELIEEADEAATFQHFHSEGSGVLKG
jgi:hypothetical protein